MLRQPAWTPHGRGVRPDIEVVSAAGDGVHALTMAGRSARTRCRWTCTWSLVQRVDVLSGLIHEFGRRQVQGQRRAAAMAGRQYRLRSVPASHGLPPGVVKTRSFGCLPAIGRANTVAVLGVKAIVRRDRDVFGTPKVPWPLTNAQAESRHRRPPPGVHAVVGADDEHLDPRTFAQRPDAIVAQPATTEVDEHTAADVDLRRGAHRLGGVGGHGTGHDRASGGEQEKGLAAERGRGDRCGGAAA